MKLLPFEKPIEILLKERKRWIEYGKDTKDLDELIKKQVKEIYNNLTAYQIVQVARHIERPQPEDYINALFDSFMELHGDRVSGEEPALGTGIGFFKGAPVMLIFNRKGHGTIENLKYHSGMSGPAGFRKAARVVRLASETLKIPIVTLIDTPGALISHKSELKGQVAAIYQSMSAFINANVPILSVITGEGGSLGALGIGISDRLLMMEYAYFAVISPEAASAVLFKNTNNKEFIADELGITAERLTALNIVDGIIEEPIGGAHRFKEEAIKNMEKTLEKELDFLKKEPVSDLKKKRFERFRNIGVYSI